MTEPFAREARRVVRAQIARRVVEPAEAALGAVILASGAAAVVLVALRMAAASGPSVGLGLASAVALALLFGIPGWRLRRARARVEAEASAARARASDLDCPRCASAVGSHEPPGRRGCEACGAPLFVAEGLVIVATEAAPVREARWRAAARHRLRHVRRPPASGPVAWLATVGLALSVLTVGARLAGAAALPAPLLEAVFGDSEESPREGTARARDDGGAAAGAPTRPRAPAWVGTQALARRDGGPWHQLAVLVRARDGQAMVVFADGDVAWVAADALLAPELAVGDRVERWDGSSFVGGEIEDRLGPAVRVGGVWTDAARIRVRVDAAHTSGMGRVSEVDPEDWIEAATEAGWRPGVRVDAVGLRFRVVTSDGAERWLDHEAVRGQRIGPGTRVAVDGREGATLLVASRVGHALAVVDARGARRWTALSRVRRP